MEIDDDYFFSQLNTGTMVGGAMLTWSTYCIPSTEVLVSVYLGRDGCGWNAIAYDMEDQGVYYIDPIELKIENGPGYGLKILATTITGVLAALITMISIRYLFGYGSGSLAAKQSRQTFWK